MQPLKKNPKKILFVTRPLSPPWDEASKNFAYDLACNAVHSNITILVDKIITDAPHHVIQKKIYTRNRFSFGQKVRLLWYLWRHVTEYDILHLLFTPTRLNTWIVRKICVRKDVKMVQTIATVRDDLYDKKTLKNMFFGDVLVTYSQWAQKKLSRIGLRNVHHIYPGINLAKFVPGEKDPALLKKWHIAPEKKTVTYPGEFVRLGATDLIVDAFMQLWKNPAYDDVVYVCACRIKNAKDAQKKQEVIHTLEKHGYRDRVVFTDTYADVNAIYNLSDIIIFPVENMRGKFDVPLAMIEPYACKKPVIASDLPLLKEFSDSQINAIIPKAHVQALTEAIIALLANAQKRKALGEHAYAFAHKTFNITHIAQHYEDIYKKL